MCTYTCVCTHYSMHMVASTLKFMKCIHEFIPYRIGHQMTRINCKPADSRTMSGMITLITSYL